MLQKKLSRGAAVRLGSLLVLTSLAARPLSAGEVTLISAAHPDLVADAAGGASYLSRETGSRLSADGRYAVFVSDASNLVAGQVDPNVARWSSADDVFLYDRVSGAMTLVSRSRLSPSRTGNGPSHLPALSADGRFVAFASYASDPGWAPSSIPAATIPIPAGSAPTAGSSPFAPMPPASCPSPWAPRPRMPISGTGRAAA